MDKRTKILAIGFTAVLAYVILSSVIYPNWIEPALNIDKRIAERTSEYERLKLIEEEVDRAAKSYRELMARIGSLDVGRVETDVRARLDKLIERHKLANASVSPGRPTVDRKTGLKRLKISVTAMGTLQSVVEFLRDASELPHVMRIGNASIHPARRRSKDVGPQRMNLRVPFELLVLPKHKFVATIADDEIEQPEQFVRHEDRDYSRIWIRKPFTEPIPLRANAGRDIGVKEGGRARLMGSATGGDRQYTYEWTPSDNLSDSKAKSPTVDTSKAFSQTYTLTVRDGSGAIATATARVAVAAKPPRHGSTTTQVDPIPPPPPPPPDKRWKDRKYMQIRLALLQESNGVRTDEVMVFNNRRSAKSQAEYYAVGDEFDGGELVAVHPHGGVVRRKDVYYLYPIGELMDRDIPVDGPMAGEFPVLRGMAERVQKAVTELLEEQEQSPDSQDSLSESEADADGAASTVKSKPTVPQEVTTPATKTAGKTGGGSALADKLNALRSKGKLPKVNLRGLKGGPAGKKGVSPAKPPSVKQEGSDTGEDDSKQELKKSGTNDPGKPDQSKVGG